MSKDEHPLSKTLSADRDPDKLAKAHESVRKEIEGSMVPKVAEDPEEDEDPEGAEEEPESEDPEEDEDAEEAEAGDEPDGDAEKEAVGDEEAPDSRDYTVDLNNVADTLVILVGRYSRMSKLLYACIALLVIGLGGIVKAGFEINYLQTSQAGLQDQLAKATKAVGEAKDAVKDTKDAVRDTQDAVEKAAEAAPKVVVDADAGTAKIVLPVKKCQGDECDSKVGPKKPKDGASKKPPTYAPPTPPPPTQKTAPLNPKVELQDEDGASF
jgi:hypothetical protein